MRTPCRPLQSTPVLRTKLGVHREPGRRYAQALAPPAAAARRLAKETDLPAPDRLSIRGPLSSCIAYPDRSEFTASSAPPSPLPSSASVYRAIGQSVWQRSAARNEVSFAPLSGRGSVPSPKQGPRGLARHSRHAKVELNGLGLEASSRYHRHRLRSEARQRNAHP